MGYDPKYNSEIVSVFGNKIINLVKHKLSVRTSAAILSNMDWYIGNDSGFSHIAVASGTNTVVIMLDSDTELLNSNKNIVKKLRNPTINSIVEVVK
jgi:ADP-heptose:LPS heptosyltransferase